MQPSWALNGMNEFIDTFTELASWIIVYKDSSLFIVLLDIGLAVLLHLQPQPMVATVNSGLISLWLQLKFEFYYR